MAQVAGNRSQAALRAVAPMLSFFAAAALLLRFPPDRYSFYPRCPIYTLFHIECPGCGATRALAAILRGDLEHALQLNALFTVALPVIVLWAVLSCRALLAHKPLPWTRARQPANYAAIATTAVFTIVRNL
ncbi:MAG TPA: DUF2752 domain-containing protein [Edaphobacter sp.]